MCGKTNCIFIDMNDMKLLSFNNFKIKELYSIYLNKVGNGPEGSKIGNEFKLSRDKLKLALKNYVCNDF